MISNLSKIKVGDEFAEDSIHNLNPIELLSNQCRHLSFNRWDVVIKYLVMEQYLENKNNVGFKLYKKELQTRLEILKQQGRSEKCIRKVKRKHSLKKFKKLITSIVKNGYDLTRPVRINHYHQLCDGSHRLGCAFYFKHKYIPCKISTYIVEGNRTFEWYKESKFFNKNDLDIIFEKGKLILPDINKMTAIILELESIFKEETQDFGNGKFYQSYEPLNIKGMRCTSERFEKYRMDQFLLPNYEVLDIGCNCGFFSHYISSYVASVDGFDSSVSLIKMCNLLKSFLENNTFFTVDTFEKFRTEKKYDFIIMAAIHKWIESSYAEISERISNLLKNGGFFFLESTKIEKYGKKMEDKKYDEICNDLHRRKFIKSHYGTIMDDGIIKRNFSIWQKK